MAQDSEVKLHFTAAAEGLNEVFKTIQNISKASNINLTDKLRGQLKQVETELGSFLQRTQQEMSKSDISPINMSALYKDFNAISNLLHNMLGDLSKLNIPAEIQKALEQSDKKIQQWVQSIKTLDSTLTKQQNKLNPERSSGLSKSAEKEARAEAMVTNEITDIPSLGDKEYAHNIEEYLKDYEKLEKAGKLTTEQINEHLQVMLKLDAVYAKYVQKIENNIVALQSQKQQLLDNIQLEKEHQQLLRDKTTETDQLSEEEKSTVNELTNAYNKLSEAEIENANSKQNQNKQTEINTKVVEVNTEVNKKNNDTITKAAKQVFSYGLVLKLFRKIYSTVISTVREMDKALTSMTVVTNLNRQQAYELTGQMHELAAATGTTATAIAGTVTMYLQQGKSISQALELTEAAARAATIAGIDQTTSVNLLTNAMNGFQLSASHAMETSDKFAALAASAATNYEELATALSKVASQANLAGLSMDFTLGLLTKGIETTREAPETIGTALKTVLSRMRELTDYGKTLEDNVDVNRVAKALSNIGIELMDQQGQFRDMESVLTEVGQKWDKLTKNQQANVAVAMAGTRQQSRFIAMMQDFDRTLELVDISANSYGATMAQSAKYMEGLEAAQNRLHNATQNLVRAFKSIEIIIPVLDGLTQLIDNIAENESAILVTTIALSVLALNLITSKLTELLLQKQISAETRKQHISKLQEQKVQLKEQQLLKLIYKEQLKKVKNNKEDLETDIKKTAEKKKQEILEDTTLTQAQKEAKIAALELITATQLSAVKIEQSEIDKEIAKTDAELGLIRAQSAQNQLDLTREQVSQYGLLGNTISALMAPLGLVTGALTLINTLKTIGIGLSKKQQTETAKEAAAQLPLAVLKSAESAAWIPYVGWGIALALLAGIGIMLAVNASKSKQYGDATSNSIDNTREELNKFQADLYNLNQSISNVGRLADEFDNLSNKIDKSNEDLERMAEIIQQVNDEAGHTVITAADEAGQLTQIYGYQASLEAKKQSTLKGMNKKLAEGLKNVKKAEAGKIRIGDSFSTYDNKVYDSYKNAKKASDQKAKQQYYEAMKADASFVNTVRTIALNDINELRTASTEARNALLQAITDGINDAYFDETNGFNSEKAQQWIEQQLQNTNLESKTISGFSQALEDAASTGTISAYTDLLEQLSGANEDFLNSVLKTNPQLRMAQKLGATTAKAFDELNYSTEQMSSLFKLAGKVANILGKDSGELVAEIVEEVEALDAAADAAHKMTNAEKQAAIANKLYEKSLSASRIATAAMSGDFSKLTEEEKELAKEQQKRYEEYNKTIETYEKQREEQEEKQDSESEADAKARYDKWNEGQLDIVGAAKQGLAEMEEASKSAVTNYATAIQALGLSSTKDITDSIEKISSTMERLNKGIDLTNLSIAEQIELLHDYPSLAKAMQRGYMTYDDIKTMYDKEIKKNTDLLEHSKQGITSLITKSLAGDEQEKSKLIKQLTDFNSDLVKQLLAGDTATKDDVIQLVQKKFSVSLTDAITIADMLIDQIQQGADATLMLSQGVEMYLSESEKEAWKTATDIAKRNQARITKLKSDLELYNEDEEEYIQIVNDYKNALLVGLQDEEQALQKWGSKINEVIKNSGLTLRQIEIIGDQAFFKEGIEATVEENALIKALNTSLQTLSKEYNDLYEERKNNAKELAEIEINAIIKTLEAQKEALEQRKEAYQEYFDLIDSHEQAEERAASMEDLSKQIAALSGGSDAATKALRKDLISQMEDLKKEEKEARKEEMRNALLEGIDKEIKTLEGHINTLNGSILELARAISENKPYQIIYSKSDGVNITTGDVPHFAEGSVIDYTGLAWVDGTKNKPEAFLNATDTVNVSALLDALNHNLHVPSYNLEEGINPDNNITIGEINISTQHLDNNQDFRAAGASLAEEFEKAIRQRGISVNVRK